MNMDPMSMGTPWLDQPVQLHSSRKSTCSLTPAQCSYRNQRWHFWYIADWTYALPTIGFLLAIVALFAIPRILSWMTPASVKNSRLWHKSTATTRFLSYKAYHVSGLNYFTPSVGIIILGAIGVIYFTAMTLGPKPYYWPTLRKGSFGGSPPLATRTGWMALALLPFVIALPMKLNLITQVTGVPHEKLQVFHRWCAWAMFVLALIHTFPFIVYHINVKHDMLMQWQTEVTYWTGVVALLAQAWLQFFSLKIIRDRFYEIFKATHLAAAVVFVVFFFLHCDFRLSSWDYFIATAIVYFLPTGLAWLRTFKEHGIRTATLTALPDTSVLVEMRAPSQVATWAPAQHMFVRFLVPSLHALTAHPFTITSSPRSNTIQFIIRSRAGFTARLHAMAVQNPGRKVKVLLDGPYGGIQERRLSAFDNLVLIAGGSGAGLTLPILEQTVHDWVLSAPPAKDEEKEDLLHHHRPSRTLTLILSTRSAETADWYVERVRRLLTSYSRPLPFDARIEIHVTGAAKRVVLGDSESQSDMFSHEPTTSDDEDRPCDKEADDKIENPISISRSQNRSVLPQSESSVETWLKSGRPDVPSIIRQIVSQADSSASTGIVACGPAGMLFDAKNAAAQAQKAVLKGDCGEIWLHVEAFDW